MGFDTKFYYHFWEINYEIMGIVFTIIIFIIVVFVILSLYFTGKSPEEKKKRYTEVKSTEVMEYELAGVGHYKGEVKPNDLVELLYDPYNKYDKNAIEVLTLAGNIVGFIPKNKNKKLLKI